MISYFHIHGLGISKQPVSTGAQITMTRVSQHCNFVNTSDGPQLNKSGQRHGERERESWFINTANSIWSGRVLKFHFWTQRRAQLKQIAGLPFLSLSLSFSSGEILFSSLLALIWFLFGFRENVRYLVSSYLSQCFSPLFFCFLILIQINYNLTLSQIWIFNFTWFVIFVVVDGSVLICITRLNGPWELFASFIVDRSHC